VNLDKKEFVEKVLEHLTDEHGCAESVFDNLKERIQNAYEIEGREIQPHELSALAHGEMDNQGNIKSPPDLEEKYPRLAEVFVLAYSEAGDAEDEQDEDEDDEDEDEDEEDSEDVED